MAIVRNDGPPDSSKRDVGMIQRGQHAGLAFEPLGIAGGEIRQNVDRDLAIELRIARPIHFATPRAPSKLRISNEPSCAFGGAAATAVPTDAAASDRIIGVP